MKRGLSRHDYFVSHSQGAGYVYEPRVEDAGSAMERVNGRRLGPTTTFQRSCLVETAVRGIARGHASIIIAASRQTGVVRCLSVGTSSRESEQPRLKRRDPRPKPDNGSLSSSFRIYKRESERRVKVLRAEAVTRRRLKSARLSQGQRGAQAQMERPCQCRGERSCVAT